MRGRIAGDFSLGKFNVTLEPSPQRKSDTARRHVAVTVRYLAHCKRRRNIRKKTANDINVTAARALIALFRPTMYASDGRMLTAKISLI